MTDTRYSPVYEFKRADIDSAGVFSGYASTFNGPVDSFGDIVAPGAFADSLKQHEMDSSFPALLWAHNQSEILGRWTSLKEDTYGLKAIGKLTLETAKAKEAHALMKDDALGLSIGFRPVKSKYDHNSKINTISSVKLFEISLVGIPANVAAKITRVKSAITSIREFEDAVRDVLGYSKREARRLAAGGWPAFAERDVRNDGQLIEVVDAIEARTAELNFLFKGKM